MNNNIFIIKNNGDVLEYNAHNMRNSSADFRRFAAVELNSQIICEKNRGADYIVYANKLGFRWEDYGDNGIIQYDYKANLIMRLLKDYARQLVEGIGFPIYEVAGSNIFSRNYPVVRRYASLYGDRRYEFKSGDKDVVMSYDASYPQFDMASRYNISRNKLPFAHFSIADCYRHEQSGECQLLIRERRFYMPDLHPYFADLDQAFKWFPHIQQQIMRAGVAAGRNYFICVEVSSPEYWRKYKDRIADAVREQGVDVLVQVNDLDKYWIINVDYKIIDNASKSREIGCIQIDIANAEVMGINYDGIFPVIVHAAVPGGLERYLYAMLDDFKRCFPLWLHPIQCRLIPVNSSYVDICRRLAKRYHNIRIDIDDRPFSVSKRIKAAYEGLVPNYCVIGEKEMQDDSNVRHKICDMRQSIKGFPFLRINWEILLSKRVC